MGFCDALRRASAPIWELEKKHPFVEGIGQGTLDSERFCFYLEQDYVFLMEYAKVFASAVVKCQQLEQMAYFATLCSETLQREMDLHRAYCKEFGIASQALEQVQMSATTSGYTGHLHHVALCGDVSDIIASVLPCQWGYNTLARHLQSQNTPTTRYAKWIAMYASTEFEAYGAWLRNALEEQAQHASPGRKRRWLQHFQTSSRWELLFWEMAWHKEHWRVADIPER